MAESITSTTSAEDERVTFRHNFNFEAKVRDAPIPWGSIRGNTIAHNGLWFFGRAFATIHGMAFYEWTFFWKRENILELTIPSLTILERLPHPIEATFHLSIHDEDDNSSKVLHGFGQLQVLEICPLVSQTVLPQDVNGDPMFQLDSDSFIVSRILWALDQLARLNGIDRRWTCYFCTMLQLEASDFTLSTNWGNPASSPPNPLDFRFDAIVDRSRHDITIACLDGRFSASKEALFHASAYFREKLQQPDASLEIYEPATRLVVEELITYILTETYAHEGPMSTQHADEILELIEKYRPIKERRLVTSIEQHLLVQLDQKRIDLPFLLRCFLLGLKKEFDRLTVAAGAMVYELHFNEYMLDYSVATEWNRPNHPIINELQSPGGSFETSPHDELISLYLLTRDVQFIGDEF